MSDEIDCPHCGGTGKVSEDFLTDDHVETVTREYCEIFNKDYGYGVESWSEGDNGSVAVKVDTTCRSCYSSETYYIPESYFTRNEEKRRALMLDGKALADDAAKLKDRQRKLDELANAERRAATLRGELSVEQ